MTSPQTDDVVEVRSPPENTERTPANPFGNIASTPSDHAVGGPTFRRVPIGTTADDAASAPTTTEAMADDEMADDMSEEEMAAAEGDVVVIAAGRDDLTTLVAAIEAAGLAGTLAGEGPFTIFAPTDEAFEAYLGDMGMTAEDALADTAFLSTLLQGHVVEAADDSGMVDNPFVSLAGSELPVTVDGDTITIGGAEIVEADIFATNGVIHVIDTVLAPS